jgi:hypothetical protein
MKQHEREFFISLIRSGKVFINDHDGGINLVIKPLTIDQSVEACQVYNNAYHQGYVDGMMNEEEMNLWMQENGLWTTEDDEKVEGFKKDLERLKVEIYNARNNTQLKDRIRLYLRAGESQLALHLSKKHTYYQNTREGIAAAEKVAWIVKNSTYKDDKLYDFNELSLTYVVEEWQNSFLGDTKSRELARTEPWKSLWVVRENTKIKLFNNPEDTELTHNQKNLIIWSQMYDNIQESLECPSKDVIEDDDMLDGWFIIQAKKREQEKAEQDLNNNTKNDKIKNASEVFVMTSDKKDADKVNSMNNIHAENIKRQRLAMIQKRGAVNQHDFADERLNIQMQQTNLLRGKRGG